MLVVAEGGSWDVVPVEPPSIVGPVFVVEAIVVLNKKSGGLRYI